MARMHWLGLSFLGLALGSVGCVPAEKYNAMKLAHDSAMERLAQTELRSVNSQIEFLLRDALARRGIKPREAAGSAPAGGTITRGSKLD